MTEKEFKKIAEEAMQELKYDQCVAAVSELHRESEKRLSCNTTGEME